jgi:hypothetical protein
MGAAALTNDEQRAFEQVLKRQAWHEGNLTYQLKVCQRRMKDAIEAYDGFRYVIKCSRRLGKSFLLCSLAVECCLSRPFAQVRYGAPTLKDLKKIIHPIMRRLLQDCPPELRPVWKSQEGYYLFPNGSEMHLAGLNKNPENLRGPACDLFIIDEAGTVNDLDYIITDIALPQFLDPDGRVVAGRRLLISGTPARTPAHEFKEICDVAKLAGNYSEYTIYDAEYPEETVLFFMKESGGEFSSTWQREYLVKDVIDEDFALVSEWKTPLYVQPVRPDDLFKFYLKYESMDIGVRDLTVCLFAHYDFKKAKLYVHDEFWVNGPQMTTEVVAKGIKDTERRPNVFLLPDPDEKCKKCRGIEHEGIHHVDKRISDVDLLLINDMRHLHKLPFQATDKGTLEEMLNELRIWVASGRVIVDPRCVQLIGCLENGVWNDRRTEFARTKAFGHFDALAALIYLVRNVDVRFNPIPPGYGKPADDTFFVKQPESKADKMKKAFGLKK